MLLQRLLLSAVHHAMSRLLSIQQPTSNVTCLAIHSQRFAGIELTNRRSLWRPALNMTSHRTAPFSLCAISIEQTMANMNVLLRIWREWWERSRVSLSGVSHWFVIDSIDEYYIQWCWRDSNLQDPRQGQDIIPPDQDKTRTRQTISSMQVPDTGPTVGQWC